MAHPCIDAAARRPRSSQLASAARLAAAAAHAGTHGGPAGPCRHHDAMLMRAGAPSSFTAPSFARAAHGGATKLTPASRSSWRATSGEAVGRSAVTARVAASGCSDAVQGASGVLSSSGGAVALLAPGAPGTSASLDASPAGERYTPSSAVGTLTGACSSKRHICKAQQETYLQGTACARRRAEHRLRWVALAIARPCARRRAMRTRASPIACLYRTSNSSTTLYSLRN